MTTLKDTLRPDDQYLSTVLTGSLDGRSEDDFLNDYLAGVAQCLASEPRYYRSFGPWWAALKQLLIERNFSVVGHQVDEDIADIYQYENDALTAVAAYLYQQERLRNGLIFSSSHQLAVPENIDDEPYELVSYDLDLESKVTPKE
jgi:hypothetical protein